MNDTFDIITIGGATVDVFVDTGRKIAKGDYIRIPIGSKNLVKNIHFDTGGGGTNVACAMSKLGFRVAIITKIGNDHNSVLILNALKKFGCDTKFVVKEVGSSDYSIILDAMGRDRTVLTIKHMNDRLRFEELRLSKIRTEWFYFCTMMGESLKTQIRLVEHAQKKGIRIVYNCSSYIIEKKEEGFMKILKSARVLIVNRKEARLLTGLDDIEEMADWIIALGPEVVAITDGPEGAYAFKSDLGYFIRPHKVEVVENTGAGDSFGAAFMAGYIRQGDIRYALELGTTEAESVIQHLGAKNRLLDFNEIEARIKKDTHEIVRLR